MNPATKVARSVCQFCNNTFRKLTLEVGREEVDEALEDALNGGVRDDALLIDMAKESVVGLVHLGPVDLDVRLGLEVLMSAIIVRR